METIVNFSQSREDIILYHVLKDIDSSDIFWIDVGANDPVNISVTLLFSMRGGHGINIEPQEIYRARYKKLRGRDINLFVGISDRNGKMVLHGSGDTATMTDEVAEGIAKSTVNVITLTEVFEKYVPKDQNVHFLKIDVEGFEEPCIRGLKLSEYRPWIILVECLPTESYEGYEKILLENGYRYAYYDGQNRYYVRKEMENIYDRFRDIENLEKYYEILSMQDATRYLSYEQSTSWKITEPLRKIVVIVKKVRQKLRKTLKE